MTDTNYVAFLRGINSGSNPTIKMDVLAKAFAGMGFRDVKTLSNSGNVLFMAEAAKVSHLEQEIEKDLPQVIGFKAGANVLTLDDVRQIVESQPFRDVPAGPQTRLYVTFLKAPLETLPAITGKGYNAIGQQGRAIFSVVDLSLAQTPDLMKALDRQFGKELTTRNWNTLQKIAALK